MPVDPKNDPAKETRNLSTEAKAIVTEIEGLVEGVRAQHAADVKALREELGTAETMSKASVQEALDKVVAMEESLNTITTGDTSLTERLGDIEVAIQKMEKGEAGAGSKFDPRADAFKMFADAVSMDPCLSEQIEQDPRLAADYWASMMLYMRGGGAAVSGTDHAKALGRGRDWVNKVVDNPQAFQKPGSITDSVMNSLSTDFAPGAGILVPVTLETRILRKAFETSPLLELSGQVNTAGPEYRFLVETGNDLKSQERGEREDFLTDEDNDELFEMRKIPVHEETVTVRLTLQQVEDTAVNLLDELENLTSRRLRKRASWKVHNGDGTDMPLGLLKDPLVPVVKTGTANSLPFRALLHASLDLDPDYETAAQFLLSKGGAKAAVLTTNSIGDYVWQPSATDGTPTLLHGYRWRRDAYLTNETAVEETGVRFATGAKPVAFGDFEQGCRRVTRLGLTVIRDEVTKPGWIKYHWRRRWGWGVALGESLRVLEVGV